MNQETISFYRENCKVSTEQIAQLNRKSNILSFLRLLVILGGGTLIFQVVQTENVLLTLVSFIGTSLLFLLLVLFQSKVSLRKKRIAHFLSINENELETGMNINKNSYEAGQNYVDDQHIYTSDLDVFGEGSIFQMMNRCATLHGNQLLANWLSSPADKQEIERRQQFSEELVADFPWWQDLQAKLYAVKDSSLDAKKTIAHYLVTEMSFPKSKVLSIYTKLVPYLSILFFFLAFYRAELTSFFILFAILNLLLSIGLSKYVNTVSAGLNKGGSFLNDYVPAIKMIEERDWKSEKAKQLQLEVSSLAKMPVSQSIERLATLLNRLDARLNILVGAFLNMFLLWDFRQIYALQVWQRTQSKGLLEAMDMLSTVEAIGSIATLAYNHSDWVLPEITIEYPVLETTNVEHPLIPKNTSISNNYLLNNHRIALITGSNMAGKSTFLRTIGINAVLAFMGARVCAQSMKVSVMQMASYMRIRDSLNESTSTFKAELDRIQKILKLVENHKNTFILLDEMLRGTNSMDKYLGSKAIIEKLIQLDGVGMIATHDLKLSELSDQYPQLVKNFHFDIKVEGEEMLFDYKLKNGPCETFNASLLLKKIGIEI